MSNRLHFYSVDMKYVRNLSKIDSRVFSVSPQVEKEKRPFVGLLVLINGRSYCAPLSSPKPKHNSMKNDYDFLRIKDKHNKLIGVINFNNMIPVDKSVIRLLNMKAMPTTTEADRAYKHLLNDQLDWCNDNKEKILKKAQTLYNIVNNPSKSISSALLKRCCDFKKLEAVLDKYIQKSQQHSDQTSSQENQKPQGFSFSVAEMKRNAKRVHEQAENNPTTTHDKNKDHGSR